MAVLRECRVSVLICLAAALSSACSEAEDDPLEEAVSGATPQGGSGGAAAGGGAAGSPSVGGGGVAGSSGSAGTGSSTPTETIAFAAGLDGFRINYYCSGNPPVCVQVMDADPELDENGGVADAGVAAPVPGNDFVEAAFDATLGEPDPGSARVTLQFSGDGQLAELARNYGTDMTPGLNLAGKVITARARVEAGGAPTVVAKMYVKTGMSYSYADSGETPLLPGVWATLRYQTPSYVADAAAYDVADVREIGIEILGRGATAPTATIVHVDTIQY